MTTTTTDFDSDQLECINAGAGAYAVQSGPGSGKTTVIVGRYKRLLGIAPASTILSLTFTAEAAKNMRQRAGEGSQPPSFPIEQRPFGFLTFHSLALAFAIRESKFFPYPLAPNPLLDDGKQGKLLGVAIRGTRLKFKEIGLWIGAQKHNGVRAKEAMLKAQEALNFEDVERARAYLQYEEMCKKAQLLDFDSLLMEMVDILTKHPEVRDRWQYEWLQVDESQDADNMQWILVSLLSYAHKNVFAVGDTAQCIYQWRSAMPELFLNFAELFAGAKVLYLPRNYRSTSKLVGFFKDIGPVKELAQRFYTTNPEGMAPVIIQYNDKPTEESSNISLILDQIRFKKMEDWNVSLLARTNRGLRPYEDGLGERGIKYHLLGKSGFWQQREIKDILAYLQLSANPNWDSAFSRAILSPFHPTRFLRKNEFLAELNQLRGNLKELPERVSLYFTLNSMYRRPHVAIKHDPHQYHAAMGFLDTIQFLQSVVKGMTATQAVTKVINELRALEYYQEEEEIAEVDNSPTDNLRELANIANRFDSLADLLGYVQAIQNSLRIKKGVTLGTVHQAKGKEWDKVIVADASEGNFPHRNGELNEEERIFFVACSRAAENLWITYSGIPSRFLSNYPPTLIDNRTWLDMLEET